MIGNLHNFARESVSARLLAEAGRFLLLLGAMLTVAAAPLGLRGAMLAVTVFALVGALVLRGLPYHAPHHRFGAANAVTSARAAAVALLLGVWGAAFDGLALTAAIRWTVVALALAAFAADGVDGVLARRRRLVSAFGARFDMETDALFVLALALLARAAGQAGGFVLMSGMMRYLFVAAGWLFPVLRAPLPPSLRRKTICVVQIGLLIAALAPPVSPRMGAALCALGVGLLIYSFSADAIGMLSAGRGSPILTRQESCRDHGSPS